MVSGAMACIEISLRDARLDLYQVPPRGKLTTINRRQGLGRYSLLQQL